MIPPGIHSPMLVYVASHEFDMVSLNQSESILRVKSEPESCPSPSQVESQVSGIPFVSQTTRSSSIRMASGKCEFFQIICIYSMSLQ